MTTPRAVYRGYRPDGLLGPFVEECWEVQAFTPARHLVVPDGCLDVIFSPSTGLQVVGAMTTWHEFEVRAGDWVIGVRFRPGAARPFLRVPLGELTDRRLPLEEMWGRQGRALRDRVGNADSPGISLSILTDQLGLSSSLPVDGVAAGVRAIVSTAGAEPIESAAARASISVRQLRRVCMEETGLTPKQLARVLRFRRAGRLMASRRVRNSAGVAAECGYYDQAHLIRDFRLLTGRTPSTYLPLAVLL